MSELASISTCRICGKKFAGPTTSLIIGASADAPVEQYLNILAQHVNTDHAKHAKLMEVEGLKFIGLLYLLNFTTTDEQLKAKTDQLRWAIHQQTLKTRYPDENLKEQAGVLAVDLLEEILRQQADPTSAAAGINKGVMQATIQATLVHAFRSIRDALEEPGKYPAVQKGEVAITH